MLVKLSLKFFLCQLLWLIWLLRLTESVNAIHVYPLAVFIANLPAIIRYFLHLFLLFFTFTISRWRSIISACIGELCGRLAAAFDLPAATE